MMKRSEDYDARFGLFSTRIEKAVIALVCCFLIILVAGQAILQYEPVKRTLSETERWEGKTKTP